MDMSTYKSDFYKGPIFTKLSNLDVGDIFFLGKDFYIYRVISVDKNCDGETTSLKVQIINKINSGGNISYYIGHVTDFDSLDPNISDFFNDIIEKIPQKLYDEFYDGY